MKKITQLPVPFVLWYWDHYCDGNECPSYIKYDQQAEYGCSQIEYTNYHNDIIHEEVKEWIIQNLSTERILELLDKWVECVKANSDRFIEYYNQTKKEIEFIKTGLQS